MQLLPSTSAYLVQSDSLLLAIMSLTPEQVEIIKSTVPILVEHGTIITTRFYKDMLTAHPELNNIFNNAHQVSGHQPRALAMALFAYATHIGDLGALGPAVELICNKHTSLYIQPEQYDIVGKYLLETMGELLGDAFTPAIRDAWGAAYAQLAKIMIDREEQLYQASEGWRDWRDFKIQKKVPESDEITSFYLAPIDGGKLPTFLPGQYISVRTEVPELHYLQARQYSLSDAPGKDYYRISVKRVSLLYSNLPSTAVSYFAGNRPQHDQSCVAHAPRLHL